MAQTTRLASFGPFSLFVGLRGPSLAAVGLRGDEIHFILHYATKLFALF